ncbi:MAG: hypothetical protein KBT31_01570 [Firmicutes bacterium]|nr:hypothetical protein [Candidatus Colimorpha enterica]
MKKFFAFLLALCFVLSVFAACAGSTDDPGDTTEEKTEVTDAPEEKPWYDVLDYDGMSLSVACRGVTYDDYVVGQENSGDIVWDSVYATNERINGALNVNRTFYLGSSSSYEFIAEAVRESATEGLYDMIMCDQFYGTGYATQGAYKNVLGLDTPKSYLDITHPCWYGDYMKNVTMGTKTLYFLGGDISPTILGWAACSFMNWQMYDDLFDDPGAFLEEVEAGNWDLDMLMEKDTAAYLDLNQNDKPDLDDRLGSATNKGQCPLFAAISAGMTFSERNSEGLYNLTIDSEHNNDVYAKVYDLYNDTVGFFTYDYNKTPSGNSDTFAAGRMLFMNEYFLYAFGDNVRDMEDDYVIIPRPKYDETQEKYLSAMQDSFFLYTIPTSVGKEKLEAISAYLQVGCELFSQYVITAMYDTALKVKNVSDKVDMDRAGRIIDLVRAGITSDFAVVYTSSMGGMANMVGTLIGNKNRNWNSTVGKQKPMYEAYLNKLLLSFDLS